MSVGRQADDEQAALWNGPSGRAWVDAQELLDRMFQPFEDLLVAAVLIGGPLPAGRVLDVGCGTGATTLAVARRLGAEGRALGIDISEPMIALARVRAERDGMPASFIRANAQDHAFEPRSFDRIFSRFGVMFFDDSVRAFANLRHAARDGAGLSFIAWRGPAENPFMTTAERAAAPLLPNLPPRRPNAPGQFAFADQQRVHGILEESGWAEIETRPIDIACTLPEAALVGLFTRLGPLGRVLDEADEQTRHGVIETVRPAFDAFVDGPVVRFTAACWLVGARARSAPGGRREAASD